MALKVNNISDLDPSIKKQLAEQGYFTESAEESCESIDFDKMLLLFEGAKQFDYYLDFKSKLVYCRAKDGTGCEHACFGTLTSFDRTRQNYVL